MPRTPIVRLLLTALVAWAALGCTADGGPKAARTVRLSVPTMHCDGCVQTLTHELQALPGVVSAKVSLEEKSATVGVADGGPTNEILIATIKEAGYAATVQPSAP